MDPTADIIRERDHLRAELARVKTRAWELVEAWRGSHIDREETMDELIGAFEDEERHWVNREDGDD